MDSVTEDQAVNDFQKAHGVTEDQAAGDYDKVAGSQQSFTGKLADDFFSNGIVSGTGRVMDAFGQGLKGDWGHSSNIEGELKEWTSKSPAFKDFEDKHKLLAKGFNEAFVRPNVFNLSKVADAAINTVKGLVAAPVAALGQAGEELDTGAKEARGPNDESKWYLPFAPVMGAAGEWARAVASGYIPEGVFLHTVSRARADGLIGEGEAGYFNTKIPSQTALQERQGAAQEAGVPMKPLDVPNQDPNLLARQIDPETFKKWDDLHELQDNLRLSLQAERTKIQQAEETGIPENHPEQVKRMAGLQILQDRIQTADQNIRDLIPDAADARNRVEELVKSDSKEGQAFRDYAQKVMLENELKLSGLSDDVRDAYGHAETLIPDPHNARPGEIYENSDASTKSGTPGSKLATQVIDEEPPLGHGMIRLYHGWKDGGEPDGGARWVTQHKEYARAYGADDKPNNLSYVDIPQDSHIGQLMKGDKDNGIVGLSSYNLPEEFAKDLKRLKANKEENGTLVSDQPLDGQGNPLKKTSSLGKKIEAQTIEDGLSGRFGDLPDYEHINMKEQAEGVAKVINEDYQRAKRIAFGREEPGAGEPRPLSFLVGVEKRARMDGDAETLRRLANSDLIPGTSRAAQDLRTLAERDPESPVAIMKSIDEARKTRSTSKTQGVVKDIQDKMDEIKSSVEDFINSIECDY